MLGADDAARGCGPVGDGQQHATWRATTRRTTVSGINVDKTAADACRVRRRRRRTRTAGTTTRSRSTGRAATRCPASTRRRARPTRRSTTEGAAQQLSRTVFDLAGQRDDGDEPAGEDRPDAAGDHGVGGSDVVHQHRRDGHADRRPTTCRASRRRSTRSTAVPRPPGTTVTFTTDGVHTLTYYSVDNAGNVESVHTVTVQDRQDRADDHLAHRRRAANGAGWNKTNVTVTFTCGDSLSGIASCTAPQTVTTERRRRRPSPAARSTTRATRASTTAIGQHRQDAADDRRVAERVGERQRLVPGCRWRRRSRAPTRCRASRRAARR